MGNISQRLARLSRMEVAMFTTMREYSSIDKASLVGHFLGLWNDTTKRTVCEYIQVILLKNHWIEENGLIIKNKYKSTKETQNTLTALQNASMEASNGM